MKHTVDTMEVDSGWMVLKGHDPNRRMIKATLVIGDERVFAESEVKAIMQKMSDGFEAEMRTSAQFPGHLEVDESVVHDQIDEACEAFGIVLDPT